MNVFFAGMILGFIVGLMASHAWTAYKAWRALP